MPLLLLYRVLQHFNTTAADYTVIFTGNCTAALRLVADSFQLQSCSEDQRSCSVATSDDPRPRNCSLSNGENVGWINKDLLLIDANKTVQATETTNEHHKSVINKSDSFISNQEQEAVIEEYGICKLRDCDRRRSLFVHLDDNHTSVLGIRTVLAERGAEIHCLTPEDVEKCLMSECSHREKIFCDCPMSKICGDNHCEQHYKSECHFIQPGYNPNNNLFAFPAQSNFNGRRYPLEWTNRIAHGVRHAPNSCNNKWFTLLDAAALLTTATIDLQRWEPDFITLSFYKMFGFPTGLGK